MLPMTLIAGFIRGFTGFGGPLFLLPVVNLFMPPAVGAGIVVWIDLFANIHLVPNARRDSSRAVILPLLLGTLVAMPIGVYVLINTDPVMMKRLIGITILIVAMILMTGWRYRGEVRRWVYGVVGTVSGLIMGATAIGALTALFLSGGRHTARQNRANFIIWAFLAIVLFLVLLGLGGTLTLSHAGAIAILTPGYVAGTVLGSRLIHKVSDAFMRKAVLALIMAVALASILL
jgi:uncharacterized protein